MLCYFLTCFPCTFQNTQQPELQPQLGAHPLRLAFKQGEVNTINKKEQPWSYVLR